MPDNLRYPIGQFSFDGSPDPARRKAWIDDIAKTPSLLQQAVEGLSPEQLDTPYRPGGWTVKQVVHHVPDSHINSYVRFKWTLTENTPTIKAYDEERWAELADAKSTDLTFSLSLLEALHERWVVLLNALSEADYQRTFTHPQSGAVVSLAWNLAYYAWHGKHHTAHITSLRERHDW